MYYYFVASNHKADLNMSYLCSLGSSLGSFVEVWLDSADNRPSLPVGNHQVLNNGHFDGHHHKSHISELVELNELGVFSVIHLVEIVEEVGLSVLLRPLFVESRVFLSQNCILSIQLHHTFSLNQSPIMVTLIITGCNGVNDYNCFLRALRHHSTSNWGIKNHLCLRFQTTVENM